ncbi:MAG: ParB/RepB/Spo0J family partition protein [Candidatus Omnitrophica bacterium]|nr:ParB/RepB/Spo0J family partition protein [Candidatus Omnitrophota bacterium]
MEKRLGKGIGALIPENFEQKTGPQTVDIEKIIPNRYQPRKKFDQAKLNELVESIREKGIIQPVLVRPHGDGYELIAGERRFRAMKELGFTEIPVIIKEVTDADSLELSLIENIQREELNSIEEAHAYKQLSEEFNFSQDQISKAVGKDKSTVSNTLRLLSLPALIQKHIEENTLTMGHAKAILALPSDTAKIRCAKKIINQALSVRQAEALVKRHGTIAARQAPAKDENIRSLEEKLQHILGTRVSISHGKKRGKIEIEYYSNDDLDRIMHIIAKPS